MQTIDRKPEGASTSGTPVSLSPLAWTLLTFITSRGYMGASFGALTGFMETLGVPWRGKLCPAMVYNENVIFWQGWSSIAAGALAEIHEMYLVFMYAMTDPQDPITALEWQSGFPLPMAKQPRRFYQTRRFLPVRFFAEGYEPKRNAVELGEGWTCVGP